MTAFSKWFYTNDTPTFIDPTRFANILNFFNSSCTWRADRWWFSFFDFKLMRRLNGTLQHPIYRKALCKSYTYCTQAQFSRDSSALCQGYLLTRRTVRRRNVSWHNSHLKSLSSKNPLTSTLHKDQTIRQRRKSHASDWPSRRPILKDERYKPSSAINRTFLVADSEDFRTQNESHQLIWSCDEDYIGRTDSRLSRRMPKHNSAVTVQIHVAKHCR